MDFHGIFSQYETWNAVPAMTNTVNWGQLTASTRPFSVGFFSIRASNTSSVSLRTYSRTMWWKEKEEEASKQSTRSWSGHKNKPKSGHRQTSLASIKGEGWRTRLLVWFMCVGLWLYCVRVMISKRRSSSTCTHELNPLVNLQIWHFNQLLPLPDCMATQPDSKKWHWAQTKHTRHTWSRGTQTREDRATSHSLHSVFSK